MCIGSLFKKPDVPRLAPLPTAPQPDSDAVRKRQAEEAARLAAQGGTAATVKTDLAPSDVVGQKKVLLGV